MTPKLVVLGNLLVDDLVFPDGSTRMTQAGGAVLYAALAARLWNVPTGCVSVCGDDYPSEMIDRLQRHAIDLGGVRMLGRPGVRAWLLYEGQVRHLVHRVGCPTHEDVSPMLADIPGEWRSAPAFHLAPMPFGVQRILVDSLSAEQRSFVSVDPHRPITEDTLDDWREMLSNADAFFPSEDEMLLEQARCRSTRGAAATGERAAPLRGIQAGRRWRPALRRTNETISRLGTARHVCRRSDRCRRCVCDGLRRRASR